MTIFWLGAGLMLVAGMGWILPALWSRAPGHAMTRDDHAVAIYEQRCGELERDHADGIIDSDQLSSARDDLAAELLHDYSEEVATRNQSRNSGVSAAALALVMGVMAVGLYAEFGAPEGLGIAGKGLTRAQMAAARGSAPASATGGQSEAGGAPAADTAMPSVEKMVAGLAKRLEDDPSDGTGWMMLGRSYTVLNRLKDAEAALEKAYALIPENPDAIAAYAEAMGRNTDNDLRGRPTVLLGAALKLDPNHAKSLWLAGIAAMQGGDASNAVALWQRLRTSGSLNAEETASLDRFIAEAGGAPESGTQGAAQGAAIVAATQTAKTPQPAPAAPDKSGDTVKITVEVSLDAALADRVQPGDSLFVFARAHQGPPMPLAVQRLSAGALPATVVLDESMAMMPQFTLATFPRIVVGARISRTGNATPSPGDLQGISADLSPGETPQVRITISEVVGG
jgi:cytochrome c-type biogenesis protein CcmH